MYQLNKDNLNNILEYLDYGEKGIIKFISKFFYFNNKTIPFNINGFILNIKMKKWYNENFDCKVSKINVKYCFKKNYINYLIYMSCDNLYFYKNITSYEIYPAIRKKNYEIIKFIILKGREINATDFNLVVLSKDEYLINFYLDNLSTLNPDFCKNSVKTGNLKILKELKIKNCPWDVHTNNIVAEKGYFNILKWAYANGCPINDDTIALAAKHGRIEIVKWLYQNNCNHNIKMANYAAYNGYLHIIKWCVENDIEIGKNIIKIATDRNFKEIIIWLKKNNIRLV